MLKSLVLHERLKTTLVKGKRLKPHADKLITIAKKNTLASKRTIIARLRAEGNNKRELLSKLDTLKDRFVERPGGYTRLTKGLYRRGDGAPICIIEYLR